ncbi:MAG: histidine kinase [Dehalococcoidia bacterium]|nr:histidine kinase [Dehalococcoidia bacterium]
MKIPSVSFRAKVVFLLAAVVFLLGIIAVFYARNDMRRILGNELETRGEAIAKDLAANSTDLLLTGDLVGLYDVVNRTKINNADVRYVLILSSSSEVRANTFGRGVPRGLLEANVLLPGEQVQLRYLDTEEGPIRDIAVPVFGGKAGAVRIGMSAQSLDAAVARNTRNLVGLVVVVVALTLAVSYMLSYYLTRPLSRLLAGVHSVAQGDLSQRITSPGEDEVGQLGRAFNLMARELERKEAMRRELMEKVISSQEEERKRVARELHDEFAQRLTSVMLSLEAVEAMVPDADARGRQMIKRAKQATESSLAETRRLVGDLRPPVLDDLGLVPAIRSYAETHLRRVGTEAVVTAANVPRTLPPAMDTAVFRIVQEAVVNVAKYAEAKQAKITLRVEDGVLFGEVADDGKGFQQVKQGASSSSRLTSFGLLGMEERATLLGGKLSVTSEPGRGTRVSFSIPLYSDNGHERRKDTPAAG